MFKSRKRNPKSKGALRRKQDDTAEEEEEDDKVTKPGDNRDEETADSSTAATIARVKKKRKLLTELQYKKGTDTAMLLNRRSNIDHDDYHNNDTADNTLAGEEAMASSSQEGIMEKKHKQALEQYVEAKLADMVGGDAKAAVANAMANLHNNNNDTNTTGSQSLTKEELYRQLAEASESMTGRKQKSQGDAVDGGEDGDVGTGGAMLVAGTGLAEVILPVEERLKAVHATQEANSVAVGPHSQQQRQQNMNYGMPKSQVPVPSGTSRFQVSAADRHRHFAPHQNNNNNNNNGGGGGANNNSSVSQPSEPPSNDVDQGRMGFEAARGKATATADNSNNNNSGNYKGSNQHGGNNNATSGRKDYKNKASDDKVYGNFLKHHRENQWRGR